MDAQEWCNVRASGPRTGVIAAEWDWLAVDPATAVAPESDLMAGSDSGAASAAAE